MKGKERLTKIIWIIAAFAATCAISYASFKKGLPSNMIARIEPCIVFIVSLWLLRFFYSIKDKRLRVCSYIGGVFLAITHVTGIYLHYINNLFLSTKENIILPFVIIGTCVLTVPLIGFLLEQIRHFIVWCATKTNGDTDSRTSAKSFLKHFLIDWGIIFACYIPVFLSTWPGNFIYDAKYQMREVIGHTYDVHHPLIHTLLMGWAYNLGIQNGDVSSGFQFYTLIQMLILSAAFGLVVSYLYSRGISKRIRIVILIILAIFPMNPLFAVTTTKDVLFAAFFVVFFIAMLECGRNSQKMSIPYAILFIIAGVLACLFRKNMILAIIACVPFWVFFVKGWKKRVVITSMFAAVILLFYLSQGILIRSVDATDRSSKRESLSVPLQQMARVIAYRGDLSEDLKTEVYLYMNESSVATYNPYLSDPVKGDANEMYLRNNFANFLKLWGKIGLQYPDEYLESIMTNTMGYWYLGDTGYSICDKIAIYHVLIEDGPEIEKRDYCPLVSAIYEPLFYSGKYINVPIFGYLFRPCVYFWFLIMFALYMIYQKKSRNIVAAILPIMYFGTCLFGPWVALRYIYCIVVSVPVLFMLMVKSVGKENEILTGKEQA